jgi:hypothetical protein
VIVTMSKSKFSLREAFAGVQDAHERPDHCLLADNGQHLFTDTSMVFANDRHVRVGVGNANGLR